MSPLVVRPARADDRALLVELLALAAAWRPGLSPLTAAEVLADPHLVVYVEGWRRDGDIGVIAEIDDTPVGGAWARRWTGDRHGYGFVAADVPEISVAVRPDHRARGVGTALLDALSRALADAGVARASLSVERDNPAAELYRRLGWQEVATGDGAETMVLELSVR